MELKIKSGVFSARLIPKAGFSVGLAFRLLFLGATAFALLQGPPIRAETNATKSLNGYAELGYRYRSDGNATDQDLTQTLSLDYFKPWEQLGNNSEVGFVFFGSMQEDPDRNNRENKYYTFREVADTYDNSVASWIYLAYGELNTEGRIKTLRLGRQESFELEPISFDGALATLKVRKNLSITAFGGLPANVFEDTADRHGDSVAGAYLDWRFPNHVSLLLGYLNLRDEVELLDGTHTTLQEDLEFGQVSWRIARTTNLLGKVSMLGSEFRDATIRGSYYNYENDLRINAYYYELFLTRDAAPFTEDPYSILLVGYNPYIEGGVNIYKGLGKILGLEGGAVLRDLYNIRGVDKETLYNHSFDRFYTSLFIYKKPFSGSQWVFGADWWTSPGDSYTQSFRGEYRQKFSKRGKFQAGTAYQLYRIDEFTGRELEHVQTYYVGITVPAGKHVSVRADYSFEDGSLRQVDTLVTRLKYDF